MQITVPLKEILTTEGQLAVSKCCTLNHSFRVWPALMPPFQGLLASCQVVPLPVTSACCDSTLSTAEAKVMWTTQNAILDAGVRRTDRSVVCCTASVPSTVTTLLQLSPSTGTCVVDASDVVVGMNVVVTGVDKSPPFPQISWPSMRAATRLGRVPDANRYWNLRSKWAPGVKSASQDRLVRWKTRLSVVVTRA